MPIYMKLEGIDGEVTAKGHEKWIEVESTQDAISRSIPSGAKDAQRLRGETSLSDLIAIRQLDKSSNKLWEYCAKGEPIPKVQIDFCTTVKDKQQPYLQYTLENVFVSSYSMSASGSGNPLPMESVGFNFTKILKNYTGLNTETGAMGGNVPASYSLGEGKAG